MRWGMAGPDIKTIDALPVPVPGDEKPAPEPDTKNLDAVLDSLNGSAERFQTLWFSFLGLTLYFAIAALTTTHRDLLLGEPKTLPLLNIQVPLLPFYVIAPLLYLIFHFYLLMMLALLARTAAEFDKQLRTTLPDEAERERYRARVENALFLQLLVGMKGERSGVNAVLLGLIALITIVLAPLATLVLMQMMFLPYHHLRITWWHRVIVVADLVLIVVMTYRCFFPRGVRKAPLVLGALSRKPRWVTAMAFCVLLAAALAPLVDWLSFQQGRWAGEPRPPSFTEWAHWMAGEPPAFPEINPDYSATEKGVVFGLFPDRLKLKDETIVGEERLEETRKETASRGGDFVPTIKLDERDLQAAVLNGADLRGVSLNAAAMQGASLVFARLDGVFLAGARLQGSVLKGAQLAGARLRGAQLQGADLEGVGLQGAGFLRARLQGASLREAQLQGAFLRAAQFQGADLEGAQLPGAYLNDAEFQGAVLKGALLRGAHLGNAQMQGADLSGTDLAESEFDYTNIFRTNVVGANLSTVAIHSVLADPVDPAEVDEWISAATQFASEENRVPIAERFARLKPEFRETGQEPTWPGMEEASRALDPDGANHRQHLAKLLGDLACGAEGAPYVARRLVRPGIYTKEPGVYTLRSEGYRLASLGDQFGSVRARMEEGRKTPEICPGVAGFIDNDWRALDAIKPD
jgi:uncharacterized protein YjbI with pentapeptide repeats